MEQELELVNERWANRKKSNLIKWLISDSDISVATICDGLGWSLAVFNNKITRNSFSFENIIAIAYMCGFDLSIGSVKDGTKTKIRASDFLDEKEYNQVCNALQKRDAEKYEEYLKMKEELKLLKEKYGFED